MSDPGMRVSNEPLKRVMFVSYYFPPSGGPGVQRTLKFVKYLARFGWTPIVLTVDPKYASYPAIDEGLVREIPDEIDVVRTRAWDPYNMYARLLGKAKADTVGVGFIDEGNENRRQALARWVRGNLFVPDARIGWVPFAGRAAKRILADSRIDAIITTGPPHSTHLVGRGIKRRTGIPWLADFRDPWTGIDFYDSLRMTDASKRRDARLEASVLVEADVVVAVTPGMVRSLSKKGSATPRMIMNGFDAADFDVDDVDDAGVVGRGTVPPVLAYVGNMNSTRNPTGLWEALSRMRERGVDFGDFRVQLVGPIDAEVSRSVGAHSLEDIVDIQPPVGHSDAIRIMKQSAMLLLVINQVDGADAILTGKLFEYIGSGRPVLGIGPKDGDAANVLAESEAGQMFNWNDVDGIQNFLAKSFGLGLPKNLVAGSPEKKRSAYSRLGQAEQLATLLDQLIESR